MASISSVLTRIKQNPLACIGRPEVEAICRAAGHTWRRCDLDPTAIIGLFIQQILNGNCSCDQVRHIAHMDFTGSAWCQARARLGLSVYQTLVDHVYQQASGSRPADAYRWRGHRVFLIDGSGISMPDAPSLQKEFGQPSGQKAGCGFPTAHVLFLFNANNGLLAGAIPAGWKRGDLADAPDLIQCLEAGDILLGDDTFGSFVVLAMLIQQNKHGVFPVHHARTVDFTPHRAHVPEGQDNPKGLPRSRWVRSLGHQDQIVEYFKPQQRPRWMKQEDFDALPASIQVREMRRTVYRRGQNPKKINVVTTLTDGRKYPAKDVIQLRGQRWTVETNIRHLKTTMRLDVLKCKTVAGVKKELCVFALVYNLVRMVMLEAARRQKQPVERISFADTLGWLRQARAGEKLPKLRVVPHRPARLEPRVKKRRPKPYNSMTKPRHVLKATGQNRQRRKR